MVEGAPAGLVFRPFSVRVRRQVVGPHEALATRTDPFDAIDLYFSDLRDQYLAGEVKVVSNMLNADHRTLFTSYSVVPTSIGERRGVAADNRERLLTELAWQYKNAVARAAATNAKNAKRLRHRVNQALGADAPLPADVDAFFADRPAALAAGAEIKAIWEQIAAID